MTTRLFSVYICMWQLLLCLILTHANPSLTNLRTIRGPHASGSGFYSAAARSVLECASLCPQYDQCDICSYDADNKLCKLYAWNGLSLPNPNNANVSSGSAVMIRNYIRSRCTLNQISISPNCGNYFYKLELPEVQIKLHFDFIFD